MEFKKTQKRYSKNEPNVKGEFAEFVINEQDKKRAAEIKKILNNYPEFEKLARENILLKKQYEEDEEDFYKLRELLESKEMAYKQEIERLKREFNDLKAKSKEAIEQYSTVKERNKKLIIEYNKCVDANREILRISEKEINSLIDEIEELKKNKGIFKGNEKNKQITVLQQENNELKEKLKRVGRIPISNNTIEKIIELHNKGYGYGFIAERTKVAKSTVCKYVQRYISGKLDIS